MARSFFDKIKTSLWVLASFIPLFNGAGFIHIGRKQSKKSWIAEGIIYEFPWIFGTFNIFSMNIAVMSYTIGLLIMIIGIIRSVQLNFSYQRLLDEQYELGQTALDGIFVEKDRQIRDESKSDSKAKSSVGSNANSSDSGERYNPYKTEEVKSTLDTMKKSEDYKTQINELKLEFDEKNHNVMNLVEKRFGKSKITYDRFHAILSDSENLFNTQAQYALDMIELTPKFSDKIDGEIRKKIDILKSIIKKTDELSDELLINMSNKTGADEELDFLFEDMERLTDSIKYYD